MKYVVGIICLFALIAGGIAGGLVLASGGNTRNATPETTTVYRTTTQEVPVGLNSEEVWTQCYQDGEARIGYDYTSTELADQCRHLAASVAG